VTVTIIATIVVARRLEYSNCYHYNDGYCCYRFIRKLKQYQFRHGIWFLIVLQSSHVLHTSMSLLNCPNVSFNVVSSSSTQSLDSIVEETVSNLSFTTGSRFCCVAVVLGWISAVFQWWPCSTWITVHFHNYFWITANNYRDCITRHCHQGIISDQ